MAKGAVMFRGWILLAALSCGCTSDEAPPSDASQGAAHDGSGGKAPDATTGTTGGSSEGDAEASEGGAADSGGVPALRDDECFIAEVDDRCVPSREVSGWHCCGMRAGEYHRELGCKDEPNRDLGCWAAQHDPAQEMRLCGAGTTVTCIIDGDGIVYHAPAAYLNLAAAGLVSCREVTSSDELGSEVATAPFCDGSPP
jgi:hypothetical protein